VVQQGAESVKLDYDMEKTARGWKVWDVRIADISLTANYRTEFANIMRASGIDGLVNALHNKNAGLERAQPAASADKKK
jgi:phospholipid transport system substrate-binding protein